MTTGKIIPIRLSHLRGAPGKTCTCFTSLIAELDALEEAVTEAVNDTPKAIVASLLMEQVLAPRPDFAPQAPAPGRTAGCGA